MEALVAQTAAGQKRNRETTKIIWLKIRFEMRIRRSLLKDYRFKIFIIATADEQRPEIPF
jgi:DNA-dependent RNA polymerase auxiliary subunit epsilon